MAEAAPSQMTGGAADWLAWLTDPKAPMPNLPDVGAAVAPYAAYATNPNAPAPSLPSLPSNAAPGVVRPAPQPPAYMAAPTPAVAQAGAPPRIPTPGASPEAQNTSNTIDSVFNMLRGSGGQPNASHSIVNNAAFGVRPASGSPSATIINNAAAATPPGAPTAATPMMLRGPLSGQQAMGGTPPPVPAPSPATPAVPSPSQQQPGVPPAPSGPPPSVPEDNSDNVAMGTGPGRAVSHDQAAALSGAATNLGTKVAQDPSTVSSILKDLSSKGLADNDENAWLALANAGFATMASRSPFVGQAIGEGAQAGLQSYQQSRAARAQQLSQVAGIEQRQQQIQQTGQGLAQHADEFNKDYQLKLQTMPADLALKAAQAQYYQDHGAYFDFRAAGGGGRGAGGGGGGKAINYIQDTYNKTYQADIDAGIDPAAAAAHANSVARGTQSAGRNAYINQTLRAMGFSMTPGDPNEAPTDVVDKIGAKYDADHGGGAPAPQRVATAAPAPAAAAAAPEPVGKAPPGTPDGAPAQGGKLVARGGLWYPAQ